MKARKQQDRSIHTRDALIRASLDQILEVGYHATTMKDIAARAGVSRGALLYHFPEREDIIAASMQAHLTDWEAEITGSADRFEKGSLTLHAFVDLLWISYSGRFFFLGLEMITEARNDPALRDRMIPVVKRFHDALDLVWVRVGGLAAQQPPDRSTVILNLTLCLLRGMGLQTVLRPEPAYYETLLTAWKSLAATHLLKED